MKTLFTVYLLLIGLVASAQELIPYLKNNHYGFCDVDGNIVIDPIYDSVEFFNLYGLALVEKDGNSFYISETGDSLLSYKNAYDPRISIVTKSEGTGATYKKDTLSHLIHISLDKNQYQFLNTKRNKRTSIFVKKSKSPFTITVSSHCSAPNFRHGYFVGENANGEFETLNSEGEVILSTTTRPTVWNEKTLTFVHDESNICYDPVTKKQTTIPFDILHNVVEKEYFIVSNKAPSTFNSKPSGPYDLSLTNFLTQKSSDKLGLANKQGQLVLDTTFQVLKYDRYGGLIAGNKYSAFISTSGKALSPKNKYLSIVPINKKYYKAKIDSVNWTIINVKGKALTNEKFNEVNCYSNRYHWSRGNEVGILDSSFNKIVSFEADHISPTSNECYFTIQKGNKNGLISADKEIILAPEFETCYIAYDKFIVVEQNNLRGLATLDGKMLFPPQFEKIEIVLNGNDFFFRPKKNGNYACFDENLNQLSDYVSTSYNVSSRSIDRRNHKGTYLWTDKYGEPLGLPLDDDYSPGFVESDSTLMFVWFKKEPIEIYMGKQRFLDLYPPDSDLTHVNIRAGLISVETNGLEGVVNHKNEVILPFGAYEVVQIASHFIITKREKKYYFHNFDGTLIHEEGFDTVALHGSPAYRLVARNIEGMTYESVSSGCSTGGRRDTTIRNYKTYGYVNPLGEIVVPLKYNNTRRFFRHLAYVSTGFKSGEMEASLIDTCGNVVLHTHYDSIIPIDQDSRSVTYVVSLNGKKGLIHLDGEIIIPLEYKNIKTFYNQDLLWVQDFDKIWHIHDSSNVRLRSGQFSSGVPGKNCFELPNKRLLIFSNSGSEVVDPNWKSLLSFPELKVSFKKLEDISLLHVQSENYNYYINSNTLKVYKSSG